METAQWLTWVGLELAVLKTLREAPHRMSLNAIMRHPNLSDLVQIAEQLGMPTAHKLAVVGLLRRGYLRRDSRDTVPSWHLNATFYTEPTKRDEIDQLLHFAFQGKAGD